jgi:hypothetical protein
MAASGFGRSRGILAAGAPVGTVGIGLAFRVVDWVM